MENMENMEKGLWIERINEYRSSGLSALKWSEANNVSVQYGLFSLINLLGFV